MCSFKRILTLAPLALAFYQWPDPAGPRVQPRTMDQILQRESFKRSGAVLPPENDGNMKTCMSSPDCCSLNYPFQISTPETVDESGERKAVKIYTRSIEVVPYTAIPNAFVFGCVDTTLPMVPAQGGEKIQKYFLKQCPKNYIARIYRTSFQDNGVIWNVGYCLKKNEYLKNLQLIWEYVDPKKPQDEVSVIGKIANKFKSCFGPGEINTSECQVQASLENIASTSGTKSADSHF